MERAWRRVGWTLALAAGSAVAQPGPETQSLRRELDALRADYEARLQALEQRLKAAEAAVAATPAPSPAPAPAVAAAPSPSPTTGAQAAVSLILSGGFQRSTRDPADYRIRGFQLPPGAEVGPGTRGFSVSETELGLAANIDPWFRGQANIAFAPDNTLSVEEAFVETTALGKGFTVRGGRFFSGLGYLNPQHRHTWDFADAPLAYQAMLGGQYGDDGVRVTWLAPTDRFLELSGELGRGRSFPGGDNARNGAGMASLSAHTGGDIGESHSWRAGLGWMHARADNQALDAFNAAGTPITNAFSGRTRLWIADAVWKWAPNGDARRTNFKLQGEYLRSTRDGTLAVDTAGANTSDGYRVAQSGWYLQGVYQFMPRWRVGYRTERLDGGNASYGSNAGLVDLGSGTPRKQTLLLEHDPSEFSRLRLQLAQDRARAGSADIQWLIQYQMSLGAHGAHGF